MKNKPVVPRRQAEIDIDSAFEFYLTEAGTEMALAFVDSLEQAVLHISRHPTSGSPRYDSELNLLGLRFWPIKNFPYLIFYFEFETHIDVWRILHAEMDIPSWMRDPDA